MTTRTLVKRLSVLCTGALLLACADLGEHGTPSPAALRKADAAYVQGRGQYLARRYGDAMQSYRAALQADPSHVNARNGLATLYAERREFGEAIRIWRALTDNASMASGPHAGFLFNNLGYAYFLAGDYPHARVALEKACLLDPLSARAWQYLGETLQMLGQPERAAHMLRQAKALREHDLRSDYAAAGGTVRAEAVEVAVTAPAPEDREWATTEVRVSADGMLELRRTPAARPGAARAQAAAAPITPPQAAAPSTPPEAAAPDVALLEIRNGNGVTGMAKALSRQIGDPGLKVVRLTNAPGFKVQHTRVEYQRASRPAAERLAERIDGAQLVEVDGVQGADMRLVLGRDLGRARVVLRPLAWPALPTPTLAAAEPRKAG
jgi:tetratricopeptide (TPR) repeat protein